MRQLAIAVAGGTALAAAVVGAAASLGTLSGQHIAAADSAVLACDTNGFDLDWNTILDSSTYPATQRVASVLVNGLDAACAGRDVRIKLTSDADGAGPLPSVVILNQFFTLPDPVPSPLVLPIPPGTQPAVADIDDLHVTQES